jgi:hypothetical protein
MLTQNVPFAHPGAPLHVGLAKVWSYRFIWPKPGTLGAYLGGKWPETPGGGSRNTPKHYETVRRAMDSRGRRSTRGAQTPEHCPTADLGHANGWRTVGDMWTGHVRSYTTPTLALEGPNCGGFWPRAPILPLKSGA